MKSKTERLEGFTPRAIFLKISYYEGWNFNSGNYLFTTEKK